MYTREVESDVGWKQSGAVAILGKKIEIVHYLMHFKSGPIFSMWDADCLDDVILLLSRELKFSKAGTCGHYMCLVEDKNQSDHLKLNIRSLPMEWQSQTWKQWEEKGGERCVFASRLYHHFLKKLHIRFLSGRLFLNILLLATLLTYTHAHSQRPLLYANYTKASIAM